MNRIASLLIGLTGVLSFQGVALAAPPSDPATANFNVTITIVKECAVTTPGTISLGTYGAVGLISSGASGTTNFNITCTATTPYTIGFAGADDLTVGSATHQMKGAIGGNTNVVQYNLTDTTAGATNTNPLSASTSVISGTGTGVAQNKIVKATVVNYTAPVTPDVYTDTVTMSVTY